MGETSDEAEARLEIARASNGDVQQRTGRYRWTVVMDDEKTAHGWADTESDAWWYCKEAVNRPFRQSYQRAPRGLFSLPPE